MQKFPHLNFPLYNMKSTKSAHSRHNLTELKYCNIWIENTFACKHTGIKTELYQIFVYLFSNLLLFLYKYFVGVSSVVL